MASKADNDYEIEGFGEIQPKAKVTGARQIR